MEWELGKKIYPLFPVFYFPIPFYEFRYSVSG
jgi:hypothetical protein